MKDVKKAYELSNAKIRFVSLVDKAANKRQFLITKADGDSASFQSFGKILKADSESHFVTGIVYEPMVEDTQGEYMTAEEIEKAAHWYMKNAGDVDIQHCFVKAEGIDVVESFVAKSDMEIAGTPIKEGTWIMTMEVNDSAIWEAIEKGDITGFSMGGVASVSDEDVSLDEEDVTKTEKRTLFQKIAKAFGYDVVEKGRVKELYTQRIRENNFYSAWYSLENVMEGYQYNAETGDITWGYTNDEKVIREALSDFNEIVVGLLANDSVTKALAKDARDARENNIIEKAGKSMSKKNLDTLTGICNSLSEFLSAFSESEDSGEDGSSENINKEEKEMKKKEVEDLVNGAIEKALAPITKQLETIAKEDGEDGEAGSSGEAGAEASETSEETEATSEEIEETINKAVEKAVEPIVQQLEAIKQSRALPNNLNDVANIEKNEDHYLHGIL